MTAEPLSPATAASCEQDGQNGALQPVLPAACASRIHRHGIIDSLADPAGESGGRR